MKKILVLGGGVAGLATAVELACRGFQPTLLEAKHFLGGRAYSFRDSETGEELDNGQHVLMTCYRHTWRFLQTTGALNLLSVQPALALSYRKPGGIAAMLDFGRWPGPIGWKAGLRSLCAMVKRWDPGQLDAMSVEQWLDNCDQPEDLREMLFRPLALAALNQEPAKASAAVWLAVLRQAFPVLGRASRLAIPSVGLSTLLVEPARRYLEERGAGVALNQRVERLLWEQGRVRGAQTADGKIWPADYCISALPPLALGALLPGTPVAESVAKLAFSGIISIHLWLDAPITDAPFVGLLGTRAQWLFNKQALFAQAGGKASSLSLVISAADAYLGMPKEALIVMASEDLAKVYPGFTAQKILRSVVIKEKSATISHELGQMRWRPPSTGMFPNFFLAGDWTGTGLPATIESAAQSAHHCVEAIARRCEQ